MPIPQPSPFRAGRIRLLLALLLLLGAGFARPALATFPERPLRLVVAYAAGGTGDLVGRLVGESLSARLGVPVVVENQGGAGGAIAARTISRAAPDGYTMMLAGNAIFAILPHMANVGFDPVKDFTAIANISESQRLLAVRPGLPITTLAELVEYGKRNQGRLNYGSSGIGSTLHVMTEMFRREAGFAAEHIPFRGSAPAVQAMLTGDIDFMIDTVVIQHVQQGRLRGLAAVGDRRLPQFPDIPTLAEQGYPNVRTSGWQALMGPANMPPEIVTLLSGHVESMLREPAFLERLARVGVVPSYRTPAQLADDLMEDTRQFGAIIRSSGISAQ
ncbi:MULTISPECIES: Bug family tripartite tricarboxylate transporter substrate binding protein [Roseomonadaceae]|uniref:Tripartite tricarboxylate transporter substrate binding protein n=1 Tax=Falsiroseomonas oleicola TaxID=2801474 RepID=A0ABS6H1X9_9PROT|nr:tripartite tricarboxylate transporter substrate binding protein [Roseomonas oleicola]MBU8542670.1 tripartite tricarboxylate transporter substrate binding protein [Roseomonas oleicola]